MRHRPSLCPSFCVAAVAVPPAREEWPVDRRHGAYVAILRIGAACLAALLPVARALAAPQSAMAPYVLESWRTRDGLPQDCVQAIAQTAEGYLWVGTPSGLARFDGVRFTHFGEADGLSGASVSELLDLGDGGLWVGTYGGGLSYGRGGVFTTLTTADGLLHNGVFALAPSANGGVWFGGPKGLQRWERGEVTTFGEAENLPQEALWDLALDRDGVLWVSMGDHGLFRQRDAFFEPVLTPSGEKIVQSYLLADDAGYVWVCIGNGRILRHRAGAWTEFGKEQGVPFNSIYASAQGAPGEIWVGTAEEGLHVLRDGKFAPVHAVTGALEPSIRALLVGRGGEVWVGTRSGGLNRLTVPRVRDYPVGEPGQRGEVLGLAQGSDGELFVATFGGGLFRGKLDELVPERGVNELNASPFLLSGICLRDGSLWFFGAKQLLHRAPGGSEFASVPTDQLWMAGCEDDAGVLWLGTSLGELWWVEDGVPQLAKNGVFSATIRALACDSGSAIWVATSSAGLLRYEAGEVRRFDAAEGLRTGPLCALHRDRHGTLWIGTDGGGLAWLRGEQVHSVSTRHGLADTSITQILEDDDGHLWLGGFRGIQRVAKLDLDAVAAGRAERVHPLTLGTADGIRSTECTNGYSPAGLRSQDGRLLFSTVRGIVAVDPRQFGVTLAPPPVLIEEVLLNGTRLPAGEHSLSIPPGAHQLEVHYTAFDARDASQLRFRHRLEGSSSEWTQAGTQRLARFSELPPGRYTFRVSAANADGGWHETGASLEFLVQPFYWQTQWFRIAMALLLMACGGGVVAWLAQGRIRRAAVRENLARANVEAQQFRNEVAHLTRVATLGELATTLAHELNQPLAAILSNAQAAQRFLGQPTHDVAELREILRDIVAEDERAAQIIQRMRAFLKKDASAHQRIDVSELMRDALALMRGDLEARGIVVVEEVVSPLPAVYGDRVQLQQVLINLMLNAGDAMAQVAPGARTLTIRGRRCPEGGVELCVVDTGPGLAPGDAERIFEPYHTTKPSGLGLGLPLSRSIIGAHGGRLWAESPVGGGAVFFIRLPEQQASVQESLQEHGQ